MHNNRQLLACATLGAMLLGTTAHAVPELITYAARVDTNAGPFSGTANATFEIFTAASGGTSLFREEVTGLVVVGGDLVHELGASPTAPLDGEVLRQEQVFLQVTLNGEVLAPRLRLTAVPFALNAAYAELAEVAETALDAQRLGGLEPAAFITTAAPGGGLVAGAGGEVAIAPLGVSSQFIAGGAVTDAKLAAGAVGTAALANLAVNNTKLAANAVTNDKIANFAVSLNKLEGNRTQVREQPRGCGGNLQRATGRLILGSTPCEPGSQLDCIENTNCNTLMCNVVSGAPRFSNCAGTSCTDTSSQNCTTSNFVSRGFLVFAP